MSRLDRYTVQETLGSGGQGTVFLARDETDGSLVAIKHFNAAGAAWRIRREVAALQLLRLPGVVELIEFGLDEDPPWLVERYVPGAWFPGTTAPLTWEALVPRLQALLRVLMRVHGQGVIHGDLKPQNVLVSDHRVTLIDLALASGRGMADAAAARAREASQPYTAPEVFGGQPPTSHSDLFAVGVMAYQALAGALPWSAADAWSYALAMHNEPPQPLATHGVCVPRAAEALIQSLLGAIPAQRPRSAAQALARLERIAALTPHRPLPRTSVLSPQTLAGLFAGPERLLHLPSRAAAELHCRTDGKPERVGLELWQWEMDGLITWTQGRYVITPDALGRLRAGEGRGLDLTPRPLPVRLNRALKDLLAWLALAWPHTEPQRIARLLRMQPGPLEELLAQLHSRNLCAPLEDGRWRDHSGGAALGSWGAARRSLAHQELARTLPVGATGRLRHLLIGGSLDETVAEAVAVSRLLAGEGRLAESVGVIELVLPWSRGEGARELEDVLLTELLASTLPTESPAVLQRTRQALLGASFAVDHRLVLVEAALAALLRHRDQASLLLATVPPLSEERLECSRQALSVRIASQGPVSAHRALLVELEQHWVQGHAGRAARLMGWWGQLAYRELDFDRAAQLQRASAIAKPEGYARLSARLMAASALLEGGDWSTAMQLIDSAASQAAACWHLRYELRAERLRRACLYRSGQATSPDEDLLAALPHAHPTSYIEALLRINEAAVCWRSGRVHRGAALAQQAVSLLSEERTAAQLIARALQHNLDPTGSADALVAQALRCPLPFIATQALGLLAPPRGDATMLAHVQQLLSGISAADRAICREVMSADEALAALQGAGC